METESKYKIDIAIIVQDVSTAAFKFIKRMNNSGFRVKSLLIMAKTPLHPKVKLQRDIRERVFVKEKYPINLQNSTCLKNYLYFFSENNEKIFELTPSTDES